jgi:NADPH:quinone reductase-like Zn-dependent oxidoreductase
VLTQGSGGVSVFAVQLAKLFGATVIVTTSSEAKAARLKELGADMVVDYSRTPDWPTEVRKLTARRGANHIVEIGGVGTLEKSIKAAAVDAVVHLVGVLEQTSNFDPSVFMRGITTVRRITVGSRANFEAMNRALAVYKIKPVIDRVFPFAEAREAYSHFQSRGHFGKVVIAGA